MASNISYDMGQIRYINGVNYMTNLNFSPHSVDTASLSETKKYQDLVFYNENLNRFSEGESYYLRIGIPKNLSYDMTFDLKLVEGSVNGGVFNFTNRNKFQEVKRFVVPRESVDSVAYSRVVLFPEDGTIDGTPIAAVAKEDPNNPQPGDIYYNSAEGEYYKKTSNGTWKIPYKNSILLNHVWKTASTEELSYFDFIFTNKVSLENFNTILLELNRNSYEDNISYTDENDNIYNGLYVDPSKIDVQCNRLSNLVNNSLFSTLGVTSFSNIGVWSHPDAIMSINGEEIRVGQSGYYELNDFEITNFGIVVRDSSDRFTLDYQYKIS